MRYALYDFILHAELSSTYCATYKEIKGIFDVTVDFPACIVQQSTTDEDRKYLGDKWQCHHCIDPETCTTCNPKYKDAVLLICPPCEAVTWHLDGSCIPCTEMREEMNRG